MHYSLNYTCGLEFRVMQFARVRPDPPAVAGIRGCLMTKVEAGDIDYLNQKEDTHSGKKVCSFRVSHLTLSLPPKILCLLQ